MQKNLTIMGKWSLSVGVLAVLVLIAPMDLERVHAQGQAKGRDPVTLEIVNAKHKKSPILTTTGWTLDMRLRANDAQAVGLLFFVGPEAFPGESTTGFLTLDDIGCNSWIPAQPLCCSGPDCVVNPTCAADGDACFHPNGTGACSLEEKAPCDDLYVEFTPGLDAPALDSSQEPGSVNRQLSLGEAPTIQAYSFNSGVNDRERSLGPLVGDAPALTYACNDGASVFSQSTCDASTLGEVCFNSGFYIGVCQEVPESTDGFGYGADDKLPGLVVTADTGIGLVYEETTATDGSAIDYPVTSPLQVNNLAGFLNLTGYELSSATGGLVISAQMLVAEAQRPALFSPLTLIDDCVPAPEDAPDCRCDNDQEPSCSGGPVAQVDGGRGPLDTWRSYEDRSAVRDYLNERQITIRAWMCSGDAPGVLTDGNGDGVVDIDDAAANGCTVISNEDVYRIRELHQELFVGIDFDRDGNGVGIKVAPSSALKLTFPPR